MAYQDERTPVRPRQPQAGQQRPASQRPVARPQSGTQRPAARPQASQQRPAARPPQQPRKRSVKPRFFIFLAILLALIVAVVVGIVKFGGNQTPDNQSAIPLNDGVQENSAANTPLTADEYQQIAAQLATEEGATVLDDSQMISVSDLSINEDLSDEWMNVLLLGTDERGIATRGRTDSMIICSVNRYTGVVKLSSIQRDLAVNFADLGYGDLGTVRINSANFFGGPEMAMKTVNELFGLNIQHYVLVNFLGFQDAVNALGGVTMDITEDEMHMINKLQRQVAGIFHNAGVDISGWDNVDLTEFGEGVRLNGQQALGYARIRKLDSDFARSERQRKVLMAMLDEVKTKSMLEIAQLGTAMMPYLTTNMDLNEIMEVAMVVLGSDMKIESLRLPVNGTYTQERRGENDMLWDCDFVQNRQELFQFIYNN